MARCFIMAGFFILAIIDVSCFFTTKPLLYRIWKRRYKEKPGKYMVKFNKHQ